MATAKRASLVSKKPDAKTKKEETHSRGIITYRTYNFIDKDPMIDQLRTACQEAFPSPQAGMTISYSHVAAESGVSDTCLRGWFEGETRRPQFATLCAVARACGGDLVFVKKGKQK